ncbi:MAG: phage tail tape measure protein [Prevotella sp.]|jgi:TP901 family phage tail tape measure protein|nr:phage tail tape measure protein [Prevotella sp.]
MAQEQNYSVNYVINVEATQGTRQVMAFADAVGKLTQAKASLTPAVTNIQKMMQDIDRTFRTKSGKKRDYSFKMNIDTKGTEQKLGRVKTMLGEIREMSKGINMVINAGQALNIRQIKAQSRALINRKALESQKAGAQKTASSSVKSMTDTQKSITKAVGKINAALVSLEKGRRINIKTDVAKSRLQEILSLLGKVKGATASNYGLRLAGPTLSAGNAGKAPYAAARPFLMSEKAQTRLHEKLYANRQLNNQRAAFREQEASSRMRERNNLEAVRKAEREQARLLRQQAEIQRKALANQQRLEREQARQQQRNAAAAVRNTMRNATMENTLYNSKQRGAINRLQYSKAPSMRNMPFAHMFNAYMGYSILKRELTEAVEYSNIMQTANSILRVADTDLSTFEERFDKMARYVRKIGVETKFTAIEVAGAVKYLSMAGMGIETINESIRPITNLALIGDNDISQIADLATNIMAGYDIKSSSMPSVADILASTVSRSNVNIIEMAESYKMAAGYLKLAGVEFSESSAAVGILGNMGVKGTMAGTSLRAMATRFAKPTKEAQRVMNRLGIKFTEYRDIYGKQVEKLRPLADIFEELNKKGATMADMQAIFGKIGGNSAMMFLKNYDKLRTLTSQNRASQGISVELAQVKQETTKGLWYQSASMFSESFMQAFELMEPQIRGILKSFMSKFQAPEFARGLASIGSAILDIITVLTNLASWVTRNFHWIEPIFFSGLVATRLFKLAGVVTNLGVAFGFLGKQAAAASSIQMISGLTGFGGFGTLGRGMSFANKRAIVSAMSAAGISGRGAMTQALATMGGRGALLGRGGMFATQVATGNGLIGAGASISALGTSAVAATAGVAALVGAMGWLAYKTWKVKEAKDAVQEEINANRKYHYPSINALHQSLRDTYNQAIRTKQAIDDLTAGTNIEDASGQKIGAFTGNWWTSVLSYMAQGANRGYNPYQSTPYSYADARNDDTKAALTTLAKKDGQNSINSAWAELGKFKTPMEVAAFMQTIPQKYGLADHQLDKSLWTNQNGNIVYKDGIGQLPAADASKTYHYAQFQNDSIIPVIKVAAQTYHDAIASQTGATNMMTKGGFNFAQLYSLGFQKNSNGQWDEVPLGKNATDQQRQNQLANKMMVRDNLIKFTTSLRQTLGGNAEAAENVLKAAGFPRWLYSNEPDYNDTEPYNANGITSPYTSGGRGGKGGADDGMAGGNYSGTGKLSSAAPKQVIVNITNLLSVETIDLMKTADGQSAEIQNLKEQMAQALIDVVHDFDASWNG